MEQMQGVGSYHDERWNIMYNEQNRSPIYSVQHYISYLRKHVAETGYARTAAGSTASNGSKSRAKPRGASRESISPVSYFLRKLKLDLKLAYANFVGEFVEAPNNGLRLLLSLLKNLHVLSSKSVGSLPRSEGRGTSRMDEYKRSMVDEQDCLLCIKYTLRFPLRQYNSELTQYYAYMCVTDSQTVLKGNSTEDLLDDNAGLLSVVTCLLSNYSKSRVTALEILTLIITGPSSVDKVLEAFTSIRLQYAESTRFKMLTSMMQTRGVSHVLFQVNCLRLLNSLLNMCRSSNMRVFLQHELEEAGLNLDSVQKNAQGDGLEYDDLRKEIREWKTRYIDVDTLLRKIKSDMKKEFRSEGLSEYFYDQKYGNKKDHHLSHNDLSWVIPHQNGCFVDYDKWINYVQSQQKEHNTSNGQSSDGFLRRDVYIPDSTKPNKILTSQSELTNNKIPSPAHLSHGKYKMGHHHENDETSLYDVISVSTSICGSDVTLNNMEDQQNAVVNQRDKGGINVGKVNNPLALAKPEEKSNQAYTNGFADKDNWILRRSHDSGEMSSFSSEPYKSAIPSSQQKIQVEERIVRHDSGVSVNYLDPESQVRSGIKSTQRRPESSSHIFYTGGSNPDTQPYQAPSDPISNATPLHGNVRTLNGHGFAAITSNQNEHSQHRPLSNHKNNDQMKRYVQEDYNPALKSGYSREINGHTQEIYSEIGRNHNHSSPDSRRIRTPSPDYVIDENSRVPPLKTSTTRLNSYIQRPNAMSLHNTTATEKSRDFPVKPSSTSSHIDHFHSRHQSATKSHATQNNLSPIPKHNVNNLKQNQFNQNSSQFDSARKQSAFENKIILNVNPANDSRREIANPAAIKKMNGNFAKESHNFTTQGAVNEMEDSGEMYKSEVSKVLQGLDKTLEQHGWKDSVKSTRSTKVPFVAYI